MAATIVHALEGLFDYAGLFPPAKLGMAEAVANEIRYRSGPEAGLLGSFVCPSSRLEELAAELERQLGNADPIAGWLPVSVLASGGDTLDELESGFEQDARRMTLFEARCEGLAEIASFEVRMPAQAPFDIVLRDLHSFGAVDVFLEIPFDSDLRDRLAGLAEADEVLAKFRTGGLTAADFPTSESLAEAIQSAMDLSVPFKLTAGLHHPYRSFRPDVGTHMHGFLNVFAACAMRLEHDLVASELVAVLEETDPARFVWNHDGLRYGETSISRPTIDLTKDALRSIGTCSIDEPVADLKALGLWMEDWS